MHILKKTVALLLCLVMVLSIVPPVPATAAVPGLIPNEDPTQVVCPHCNTVPQWKAWDGTKPAEDTHLYLSKGMTLAGTNISYDVVLNLNGQTLKAKSGGKLFLTAKGGELTILDASSAGTGTLAGIGSATSHAGVIQGNGGNVTIYGGTYRLTNGADFSSTKNGGLVYASTGSVVKVYGGTFYGANYANGGAFAINNGQLYLQDATVYPGKATKGDSIWIKHDNTVFAISGNTVIEGGVEIESASSVSLSGKPVIVKAEGGSAYSLKLASGIKLELGQLEEGSRVGITANGIFAGSFATPDMAANAAKNIFFAEAEGMSVRYSGLQLAAVAAEDPTGVTCPHCDTVPQWQVWDGTTDPAAGHYYLAGDTLHTAVATLNSDTEAVMVLNLNGYTLSRESGRMFLVQASAKLVVMDSSAYQTGAMAGAGSAANHGSIIQTYKKGTAEIYGGSFYLRDDAHAAKNGALMYLSTGTLTVYGGSFYGAEAVHGGAVAVNSAKLYLRGGTFYPGKASGEGDTIRASGASSIVDIRGETVIEGGVQIGDISALRISGGPTIRKEPGGSAYSLKTVTPIALGTMSGIRKIGITGEGVFASFDTEDEAKKALNYFIAEEEGMCIQADGKDLRCAAFTDPSQNPNDPGNDDQLNILLIGNSYSYYWTEELWALFNAAGYKNVTICNVYYSGCYFERHWKWYESGVANYWFCVVNSDGQYKQYMNYDLLKCMAYKNWDIISFQQSGRYVYSTETPQRDLRESLEPWLGNLYALMTSEFPYSDYFWQQSWSHEIGNGVRDLEHQMQVTRAHRVVGIETCEKYGFTRVPCGDAWELVRHDPIIKADGMTLTYRMGDDPDTTEVERFWDDLTHDGDVGGGQFLNACVWFETITGKSVLDVNFTPHYSDIYGGQYPMSAEKADLLRNAAHTAVQAVYGQPDEEDPTEPSVPTDPTEPSVPESVRGDLNGDGSVSDADAMYLLRYTLFGESRYPLPQSGDVNGDGSVSDADAMYLLRYTLFGESRYPLH